MSCKPPEIDSALDALLRINSEALLIFDDEGRLVSLSDSALDWLECAPDQLLGRALPDFLPLREALAGERPSSGVAHARAGAELDVVGLALSANWDCESLEGVVANCHGRWLPVRLRLGCLRADRSEAPRGVALSIADLTEAAMTLRALDMARSRDAVTGLTSREGFEAAIEALDRAPTAAAPYWIVCLDCDQFRVINDVAGHLAGDALLMELAQAFVRESRRDDLIARLGADEYAILLQPCNRAEAERIVGRLMRAARELHFCWKGRVFPSTVSVGAAPAGVEGMRPMQSLALAERARYVAKESGRDSACFASDDQRVKERAAEMLSVERILEGLENHRFELFAQDVRGLAPPGRIVYREVLMRMRDADGGLVSPGCIIPGAERYYMMDTLDRWIVDATLNRLAGSRSEGVVHAINLSGQSLSDGRFRAWLEDRVAAEPLALRQSLCFEVTETAVVRHLSAVKGLFDALAGLGATLALDDFGAGMSSFAYLSQLPVRYVKIDGQFVRALDASPLNEDIIRAICVVGHAAGACCIAEHVETEHDLERLAGLGADLAQGWGIARERPLEELLSAPSRQAARG